MGHKLQEAEEFQKQAEKCLKTSFLRWKPDYDLAAGKYQQAALCFRSCKEYARSKDCLLRAADCYQQNLALFHAAKCLDQVTLLSKDLNEYQHVLDLGLRASYLFLQYGAPEAAVNSLDKAGKTLESQNPEHSVKLYQRAAEILKNEDNQRQAAEYLNRCSKILIRLKMYDQAAEALQCEIQMHEDEKNYGPVGRLLVCLILVHLTCEDSVAAEKAFRQWANYCQEPERINLENLLRGYDEEDTDLVRACLAHPFIVHMDVDFAKLAKNMPFLNKSEESGESATKNLRQLTYYEKKYENIKTQGKEDKKEDEKDEAKQPQNAAVEEEDEGLC